MTHARTRREREPGASGKEEERSMERERKRETNHHDSHPLSGKERETPTRPDLDFKSKACGNLPISCDFFQSVGHCGFMWYGVVIFAGIR